MRRKDNGEFVIPIVLIILSILLYVNTYSFKFTTYEKASPQMWPRGVVVLLAFVSVVLIVRLAASKPGRENGDGGSPIMIGGMMVKGILLLALYIYLLQYVGYILSTLGFTLFAMLLLGNRKKTQLILVPLAVTGFVFLVFTYGMFVPLPKGIGIFRSISLLFQ